MALITMDLKNYRDGLKVGWDMRNESWLEDGKIGRLIMGLKKNSTDLKQLQSVSYICGMDYFIRKKNVFTFEELKVYKSLEAVDHETRKWQ